MMGTFEMEDFSLLVDDWNLGQPFDLNQYDDLEVTRVKDDRDFTVIKTETQVDLQDSTPDSSNDGVYDPFGADWMENADLLQLLDVAGGVLEETATTEVGLLPPANFLVSQVASKSAAVEASQQQATTVNYGYEFLHDLLKQSQLNMVADVTSVLENSPPTSPEAHVAPDIDAAVVLDESSDTSVDLHDAEFLGSPLSADDVESLLSTSPAPSTIDTSSLIGDCTNSSAITCPSSDLYQLVANVTKGQKSRSSPYSRPQNTPRRASKAKGRRQTATISPGPSELELELMSKKDRKKLQNKNAAIRYRQKKKEEAEVVCTEVSELESIHQGLTEKMEQLQREIQYMKDLIRDVQKARGVKIISF